MGSKGFTLIELLIVVAIAGIGLALLYNIATGNTIIPSKQNCISAGGKYSEGIQFGRMTQLCTYN